MCILIIIFFFLDMLRGSPLKANKQSVLYSKSIVTIDWADRSVCLSVFMKANYLHVGPLSSTIIYMELSAWDIGPKGGVPVRPGFRRLLKRRKKKYPGSCQDNSCQFYEKFKKNCQQISVVRDSQDFNKNGILNFSRVIYKAIQYFIQITLCIALLNQLQ